MLPADAVVPKGLGGIKALVNPEPSARQKVSITGDFCNPAAGCKPVLIEYTASAPDKAAPAGPTSLLVNVHDYVDHKSNGGDCTLNSDLAYWIHLEGMPAATGDAPVIFIVDAFRDVSLT